MEKANGENRKGVEAKYKVDDDDKPSHKRKKRKCYGRGTRHSREEKSTNLTIFQIDYLRF